MVVTIINEISLELVVLLRALQREKHVNRLINSTSKNVLKNQLNKQLSTCKNTQLYVYQGKTKRRIN